MFHLRGRFCFHIQENMAQNIRESTIVCKRGSYLSDQWVKKVKVIQYQTIKSLRVLLQRLKENQIKGIVFRWKEVSTNCGLATNKKRNIGIRQEWRYSNFEHWLLLFDWKYLRFAMQTETKLCASWFHEQAQRACTLRWEAVIIFRKQVNIIFGLPMRLLTFSLL